MKYLRSYYELKNILRISANLAQYPQITNSIAKVINPLIHRLWQGSNVDFEENTA